MYKNRDGSTGHILQSTNITYSNVKLKQFSMPAKSETAKLLDDTERKPNKIGWIAEHGIACQEEHHDERRERQRES